MVVNSISQSCTIIWPAEGSRDDNLKENVTKSASRKRKKKNVTANNAESGDAIKFNGQQLEFEPILPSECKELIEIRKSLFQDCFTGIERLLSESCSAIHEQSLKALSNFVEGKEKTVKEEIFESGLQPGLQGLQSELQGLQSGLQSGFVNDTFSINALPTALLILGMGGVDDASRLYQNIASALAANGNNRIALLHECLTLKKVLTDIMDQLIDDDFDELEANGLSFNLKRLSDWYGSFQDTDADKPSKLVVLLPEVEACNPMVLQNLVSILRSKITSLPLVLVMGLATSFETFNQILSKKTLSMIDLEAFRFEQPKASITAILENIFLTNYKGPIISPRCLKILSDYYFLHDLSVTSFVQSIKYAIMEYFYGCPLSVLIAQEFPTLTRIHLEYLRSLPSFIEYVEARKDNPEVVNLLFDDDALTSKLPTMISVITEYRRKFHGAFNVLLILQNYVGSSTLRKSKFDLIILMTQPKEKLAEYIETVRCLLKLLKRASLGPFVKDIVEAWSKDSYWNNVFSSYREKLLSIIEKVENDETDDDREREREKDREKARLLCQILITFFQKYLIPYDSFPLHEVFYPDSSKNLMKAFHPQTRYILHSALKNPTNYINCSCCRQSSSEEEKTSNQKRRSESSVIVQPSLPDTSILYKLFLEQGKFINLHDWYITFGCILEDEKAVTEKQRKTKNDKSDVDGKKKQDQDLIMARFIAAVSELQFLGYINPAGKLRKSGKRDYVTRMTFENQ